MTTQKERFNKAIRDVRKQGVKVKQNVNMCCRSCIGLEDLGIPNWDVPYTYTYGGQGSGYKWIDDKPVHTQERKGEPVKVLYFNHGGEDDAGLAIACAMRDQGFKTEWDGSDDVCIGVFFE